MTGPEDDGTCRDKRNRYRRAAMLHPQRQRIARPLAGGAELSTSEIAGELGEALGRVSYHVRVLVKRGVLKAVPKRRPAPPLYRWSPQAQWAREMLVEEAEGDS